MKAFITVRGEETIDGQAPDVTEMATAGTVEHDGENWILHYKETEVTGMAGTETTLNITPDTVTICRTGTNTGMMVLEKHRRHHCEYTTPYGVLDLGIYTTALDCALTEQGGTLDFCYTIGFNTNIRSGHNVHITVKTAENTEDTRR